MASTKQAKPAGADAAARQTPPPSPSAEERVPGNGIQRNAAPQLEPTGLEQAEFVRTTWCATLAQGVRPEHLLDPAFWAHHAHRLAPWAKIEVRAIDGTWYGEYIVTDCSRSWAKVKPTLGPVHLTTKDVSLSQAQAEDDVSTETEIARLAKLCKVDFTPSTKWRVVRDADKVTLTQGKSTRDDAEKWLRAHVLHELGKGKHPDEVVAA